jgi:hypothetical protein
MLGLAEAAPPCMFSTMSFSLGWYKRDLEGRRVKVQFELVRDKATWLLKPARHERWEPLRPEAEDWEALFEVLDRHLARGKVSHEDVRFLRRQHKEETGGG